MSALTEHGYGLKLKMLPKVLQPSGKAGARDTQEPLGKGQCIARAVLPWQDGDAWPCQFGADPLLGDKRALGQVPALHRI